MAQAPHIPSIELLESTHKFPGPYIFKAIGAQDTGFVARVVAAVREELKLTVDPPHEERVSEGGRHVAVTVTIRVQSAVEVRAVYGRLLTVRGLTILL
ncbi:MAG: DUF493 domain-containing protein [Verrucomicrobiales bacterium]